MIELDKDISIPAAGQRGFGVSEALRTMDVGDSFVWHNRDSLDSLIYKIGSDTGRSFTISGIEDGEYRVWLTV